MDGKDLNVWGREILHGVRNEMLGPRWNWVTCKAGLSHVAAALSGECENHSERCRNVPCCPSLMTSDGQEQLDLVERQDQAGKI